MLDYMVYMLDIVGLYVYMLDPPCQPFTRPDLGFDPEETFNENYAEACDLLQHILSVPPMGEKFTAAVSGLHSLANILDRLFQAWADEKEKLDDGVFRFDAFYSVKMCTFRCKTSDVCIYIYIIFTLHATNCNHHLYK